MNTRLLRAALLLGTAALLLVTQKGRAFRMGWGKRAGGVLGGQLGRVLGQQIGGHPIRTARVARRVRRLLSSRGA